MKTTKKLREHWILREVVTKTAINGDILETETELLEFKGYHEYKEFVKTIIEDLEEAQCEGEGSMVLYQLVAEALPRLLTEYLEKLTE